MNHSKIRKLPNGAGEIWYTAVDPNSGHTYYYHSETLEVAWAPPATAVVVDPDNDTSLLAVDTNSKPVWEPNQYQGRFASPFEPGTEINSETWNSNQPSPADTPEGTLELPIEREDLVAIEENAAKPKEQTHSKQPQDSIQDPYAWDQSSSQNICGEDIFAQNSEFEHMIKANEEVIRALAPTESSSDSLAGLHAPVRWKAGSPHQQPALGTVSGGKPITEQVEGTHSLSDQEEIPSADLIYSSDSTDLLQVPLAAQMSLLDPFDEVDIQRGFSKTESSNSLSFLQASPIKPRVSKHTRADINFSSWLEEKQRSGRGGCLEPSHHSPVESPFTESMKNMHFTQIIADVESRAEPYEHSPDATERDFTPSFLDTSERIKAKFYVSPKAEIPAVPTPIKTRVSHQDLSISPLQYIPGIERHLQRTEEARCTRKNSPGLAECAETGINGSPFILRGNYPHEDSSQKGWNTTTTPNITVSDPPLRLQCLQSLHPVPKYDKILKPSHLKYGKISKMLVKQERSLTNL